ncbi:MAG: hypothetical protein AAB466_02175 [Verrucomicrobiota bacterium]
MTMETRHKSKPKNGNGGRPQGHLDYKATLWPTANKLRRNLNAAEYQLIVVVGTPCSGLANTRKLFNDSEGGVPEREERSPIHAH